MRIAGDLGGLDRLHTAGEASRQGMVRGAQPLDRAGQGGSPRPIEGLHVSRGEVPADFSGDFWADEVAEQPGRPNEVQFVEQIAGIGAGRGVFGHWDRSTTGTT